MWHLAADAPTRPECRCCIKINESPTAHPFAPREREKQRAQGAGLARKTEMDWKRKGKKERNRERIVECNGGQWLVGGQVLCERRALSCVLCFVTGDPLREIEKAATLIRSESSCSPSLFFHLSVPPLHSVSPLLFWTNWYKRLRLVFLSVRAYARVCLLA